jgi:hypothetical protein
MRFVKASSVGVCLMLVGACGGSSPAGGAGGSGAAGAGATGGNAGAAGATARGGAGGSGAGTGGAAGSDGTGGLGAAGGKGGAGGAGGSAGAAGVGGTGACDDVAAQFLPGGTNPNGVWSYGWISNGGSTPDWPFTPFRPYVLHTSNGFADLSGSAGLLFWYSNLSSPNVEPPLVGYNPTSSENHYGGTVTFEPGQFVLQPGSAGQLSVARWTATESGVYNVSATFTGLSGYGGSPVTTTDVHLLIDNSSKLETNGFINISGGTGNTSTFGLTGWPVSAGDSLDFAVGDGDGKYENDSTALSAQICRL